jgi:acyl-CoA thioesterase FadM
MTPRRVTTFRIDEEVLDAMQVVFERDAVQPAEQARRAYISVSFVDGRK